jgi:CRP/FNR family cyclic AMP-dependent transcriptional regulator
MAGMDGDAKRAALAQIDFFKGLNERELNDLAHLSEERAYAPGEELCHESAFGLLVFAIVDGEAAVTRKGEEVGVASAGDVVGELAMLGDGHRTATLTARTPMQVLVLEPDEIDSVLAADPSAAKRLGRHDTSD